MALDRTDFEILSHLRKNARLSNKELAQSVGLAPSSCLARVRHLRASGVIRGYHAELDTRVTGSEIQALVAVKLHRHSRQQVDSFRQHLLQLPEVVSVLHTSGASDFQVQAWVRNTDHLRDFVLSGFTERPEVAHIETSLIYQQWQSWELPLHSDD
ncbi:MAG: Lrp/AsnC family transcriptional regulator [Porticoccaceae bacterium]|nr:Lrp/AsnC family transcriptional regulator [Porticoccaceae bacterium]